MTHLPWFLFSAVQLAFAGPATVLEHRVTADIDRYGAVIETVIWEVRIDDPDACAAGILTPPGLDGATHRGALVLEDLLVIPPETSVGTTYRLEQTHRTSRGAQSAVHISAPDLPTKSVVMTITAPIRTPLTVWADPEAERRVTVDRRNRTVQLSWSNLPPNQSAQQIWSTWPDWQATGRELNKLVDRLIATKRDLPRHLATGLEGMGVGGIVEAAYKEVPLIPGSSGGWSTARSAKQAINSKEGNPAERGLVVLSLLRSAGIKAYPGTFRGRSDRGQFPVTVPAPTLLEHPLVVAETSRGRIWIDPASEHVQVPDRAAAMLGATVWIPGDLPMPLGDENIEDGHINIVGAMSLDNEGGATWELNIHAEGAAREYLRQLLSSLDEEKQREVLSRLIHSSRPGVDRLTIALTGVEKLSKQLTIRINGHDPSVLGPMSFGRKGTVAAIIAPAMAAWLPPNIAIEEQLAISAPPGADLLGTAAVKPAFAQTALITRKKNNQGNRSVLTTTVVRPYRSSTPALDVAAKQFLVEEQGKKGLSLLMFPHPSKSDLKNLRDEEQLSAAERVAVAAMLAYRDGNDRGAVKAMKKFTKSQGNKELVQTLAQYLPVENEKPWQHLLTLASTPEEKLVCLQAMRSLGGSSSLLINVATDLASDEEASSAVRGRAALIVLQITNSEQMLATAREHLTDEDSGVALALAARALEAKDFNTAEELLKPLLNEKNALARVMMAQVSARSGAAILDVITRVQAAISAAPQSPQVAIEAARAYTEIGNHKAAFEVAITAARLQPKSADGWSVAAEFALRAGQLQPAIHAAHRAYLLSKDVEHQKQLKTYLAYSGDERLTQKLLQTTETRPRSLDNRITLSTENGEGLLAVLNNAEFEVTNKPKILSLRAQLRIDAGELDLAARDAMTLYLKHDWMEGAALAFAATAGHQVSPALLSWLDNAANRSTTPRLTRMEYRLITLSGDAYADAKRLDDPRAALIKKLKLSPKELISELPEYKDATDPKVSTPVGFVKNALLSRVPGVVAFSDKEGAQAIIISSVTNVPIPPPLNSMYSAQSRVLERLINNGVVQHLSGGLIPLFIASEQRDGLLYSGVAFTAAEAKRALARSR